MLNLKITRPWLFYIALQVTGLFHLFCPLPYYYRHYIGRFFILPLLPGGPVAGALVLSMRQQTIVTISDQILIAAMTLLVNCSLFALAVPAMRWAVRIRKNSWRANADTFN